MRFAAILILLMLCVGAACADRTSYGLSNCWRVAEFATTGDGVRSRLADFSFLATVKKDTFNSWTNGVSIDSFYAYSSTGACVRIRKANPGSTLCGLYAAVTNGSYALSILGIGERSMEMLLPIELDGKRDLSELTVDYDAWKFTEKKQTALTFSACRIDDLAAADSADWVGYDVYTSDVSTVSRAIRIPPRLVNGARYVCFRWSVPKQTNSAILGISDVEVMARFKPEGTLLLVR